MTVKEKLNDPNFYETPLPRVAFLQPKVQNKKFDPMAGYKPDFGKPPI